MMLCNRIISDGGKPPPYVALHLSDIISTMHYVGRGLAPVVFEVEL